MIMGKIKVIGNPFGGDGAGGGEGSTDPAILAAIAALQKADVDINALIKSNTDEIENLKLAIDALPSGSGFDFDIGVIADRDAHDSKPRGFVYFATDVISEKATRKVLSGVQTDGVNTEYDLGFEVLNPQMVRCSLGGAYQTNFDIVDNKIRFKFLPVSGLSIVAREYGQDISFTNLFVKLSDTDADWSVALPVGSIVGASKSGAAVWGAISGLITDQTDLVKYIADEIAKIDLSAYQTSTQVTAAIETAIAALNLGDFATINLPTDDNEYVVTKGGLKIAKSKPIHTSEQVLTLPRGLMYDSAGFPVLEMRGVTYEPSFLDEVTDEYNEKYLKTAEILEPKLIHDSDIGDSPFSLMAMSSNKIYIANSNGDFRVLTTSGVVNYNSALPVDSVLNSILSTANGAGVANVGLIYQDVDTLKKSTLTNAGGLYAAYSVTDRLNLKLDDLVGYGFSTYGTNAICFKTGAIGSQADKGSYAYLTNYIHTGTDDDVALEAAGATVNRRCFGGYTSTSAHEVAGYIWWTDDGKYGLKGAYVTHPSGAKSVLPVGYINAAKDLFNDADISGGNLGDVYAMKMVACYHKTSTTNRCVLVWRTKANVFKGVIYQGASWVKTAADMSVLNTAIAGKKPLWTGGYSFTCPISPAPFLILDDKSVFMPAVNASGKSANITANDFGGRAVSLPNCMSEWGIYPVVGFVEGAASLTATVMYKDVDANIVIATITQTNITTRTYDYASFMFDSEFVDPIEGNKKTLDWGNPTIPSIAESHSYYVATTPKPTSLRLLKASITDFETNETQEFLGDMAVEFVKTQTASALELPLIAEE